MSDALDVVLESIQYRFRTLKKLGDGALEQLDQRDLNWTPDSESNSVAVIVQHLHGNMMSRWTDFLASDGEKPWRERDGEFEPKSDLSREDIALLWEKGWSCLFAALDALTSENLGRDVKIRGQELTAIDAIHRQLSHYGYHVGQIVYLGKWRKSSDWRWLSISRGQSRQYKPDCGGRD